MRGGAPGAMTRASCPVLRRCLSTCSTEPVTPLMCGRKDSDTTATLMQAVQQRHRRPLMSLRCRVEDQWVNTCPFPRRLEIGSKDPAAKGRPAQAVCNPGYNSKPDQGYL